MWLAAAAASAAFAGITAILSKCGVKNTRSNLATAVRTSVVLVFAWTIVFITGAQRGLGDVGAKSWVFLLLSGVATGASWLAYFKALSIGETSKVAAVDKSSVVLSVLFAILLFPEERGHLGGKLGCLVLIAVGTFLMTDVKKEEAKTRGTWLFFALLSAVFAAATSLLAKVGIDGVDSNLATAIRTGVVFAFAWGIVFARKQGQELKRIERKDALFLVLSGIATGASWLCYYYAIEYGQMSVVVPIDKTSIIITVLFSAFALKEKQTAKTWVGLSVLTLGILCMAIFA